MSENIKAESRSGDIEVRALYNDSGYRGWHVQDGSDSVAYVSRPGGNTDTTNDGLSKKDFTQTDTLNIRQDGSIYEGSFCWYSADIIINNDNPENLKNIYTAAPLYNKETGSDEFNAGWKELSDVHSSFQKNLATNPDYIKASEDVRQQLGDAGVDLDSFFNTSTNLAIQADALKLDRSLDNGDGDARELPSSIYWGPELETAGKIFTNEMSPEPKTVLSETPEPGRIEVKPDLSSDAPNAGM